MRELIEQHFNLLQNSKNRYEFRKNITQCCEQLPCADLTVIFNLIKKEKSINEFINKFKKRKMAIISNFTVDMITDYMQLIGLSKGVNLTTYYPGYNQYAFEISKNNSRLYQLNPDYICLLIDETAIFEEYEEKSILLKKIQEFTDYYLSLLLKLRDRAGSIIILNSISLSKQFLYSYLDYETRTQILLEINKLNQKILEFSLSNNDIYLIDMNLILQHEDIGYLRDDRLALYAKMQMTDEVLKQFSIEVMKIISAASGYSKKCIALDLDNTLWDGILGDDGVDGIDTGESVTGIEFKHLQKLLKHFKQQGIVLAINSKNDEKTVDDVFSNNKEMVLSKEDFINIKSNWRPKHENLIDIANESNLSQDSILFVDDSEVECALVENFLPEIELVCAKEGPIKVIERVICSGYFEKVMSTKEDTIRTQLYQSEKDRKTFLSSVDTISNFLEHLNIKVEIFHPDAQDISRLHQMVLRINQFNLTTKRYSEIQIANFISNKFVIAARVSDKFGPYGVVSAAFLKIEDGVMLIDNLLLSCRVFSRGIEDAMLSSIMKLAKLKELKLVKGFYFLSTKNFNVSNFYSSKGFELDNKNGACSIFKKSVDIIPKYSSWLTVNTSLKPY